MIGLACYAKCEMVARGPSAPVSRGALVAGTRVQRATVNPQVRGAFFNECLRNRRGPFWAAQAPRCVDALIANLTHVSAILIIITSSYDCCAR
eukprot:9157491-Pyramimonas_sp.AAC.1